MFEHMKEFIQQVREELHIMRLELMETKQGRVRKKTQKKRVKFFAIPTKYFIFYHVEPLHLMFKI